jgi:hypothetical protein
MANKKVFSIIINYKKRQKSLVFSDIFRKFLKKKNIDEHV